MSIKLRSNPVSDQTSVYRSRLTVASPMDPNSFMDQYDLAEIMRDKERWIGDKTIQIRIFPKIILTNIRRVRVKIPTSCGVHPITAASIQFGLEHFHDLDGIKLLRQLRLRFDSAPKTLPGLVSKTISSFLGQFEVDTPDTCTRINPRIPEDISKQLADASGQLGVVSQKLAVLCLCFVMSRQTSTNLDDKNEMEEYLRKFYELVDLRGRSAKALMGEFGVPEIENGA